MSALVVPPTPDSLAPGALPPPPVLDGQTGAAGAAGAAGATGAAGAAGAGAGFATATVRATPVGAGTEFRAGLPACTVESTVAAAAPVAGAAAEETAAEATAFATVTSFVATPLVDMPTAVGAQTDAEPGMTMAEAKTVAVELGDDGLAERSGPLLPTDGRSRPSTTVKTVVKTANRFIRDSPESRTARTPLRHLATTLCRAPARHKPMRRVRGRTPSKWGRFAPVGDPPGRAESPVLPPIGCPNQAHPLSAPGPTPRPT